MDHLLADTPTSRFEVLLQPSLRAAAEVVARRQGLTLSVYVRQAIHAAVLRDEAVGGGPDLGPRLHAAE